MQCCDKSGFRIIIVEGNHQSTIYLNIIQNCKIYTPPPPPPKEKIKKNTNNNNKVVKWLTRVI